MRVLSLMSSRLFCLRMRVSVSNMLFSCLEESGIGVSVAWQTVFREQSMKRENAIIGFMFDGLTFIGQK